MPDASLPGAKRARSLTIAGILDIVLGGLGLAAGACLLAVALGVAAYGVFRAYGLSVQSHDHSSVGASIAMLGLIFPLGLVALTSVLADACLVATGIQLLRRSRAARWSALVYACLMVPLGSIDVAIASQAGDVRWIVLASVLPMPIYAVTQVAAFFVVPSWRALLTSPCRATSSEA